MNNTQRGVSLGGLMIVLFILVIAGLVALKVVPPYMEFYRAKAAIEAKQGGSVAEIRRSFDARATIDDITVIKGSDLEITKEGNEIVTSFAYRKEIPLFANVGLYIDFAANSKGQ
jgi:hypothetical protein